MRSFGMKRHLARGLLGVCGLLGALLWTSPARASWTVLDEPSAWLNASDHVSGDVALFGFSVAIDDGVIVVGSHLTQLPTGEGDGQAYVFVEPAGGWGPPTEVLTESAVLRACAPGFFAQEFGYDVDIDSGVIAVGARYATETFRDVGAGYLFQESSGGWVTTCAPDPILPGLTARVTAADGNADDRLGVAVATSGGQALFGAPKDDEAAFNAGASYLYTLETLGNSDPADDLWLPVGGEKLLADLVPDFPPFASDFAGDDVAISAPTGFALVSAPNPNFTGPQSGEVYSYDLNGIPAAVQVLQNPLGPSVGDEFGAAIALSPDGARAVVSQRDHDSIVAAGLAHVYRLEAGLWVLEARLDAPDPGVQDFFGNAVAIDGDRVVVGVAADDDQGSGSGSAWVFVRRDGGTPDPSDDVWEAEFKLLPPEAGGDLAGQALTRFGTSVAISGATVVVGRPEDDWDGVLTGSAYVYELPPPLSLAANGTCPGSLTVTISGGTEDGAGFLVAGGATGTTTIPVGGCAGSEVDVEGVLGTLPVSFDSVGNLNLAVAPPAGLCGAFLQAVDLATCRVTNVVSLP